MAHQPAAGSRDRHPGEVRHQRQLCDQLAELYRLWGYREVAPPGVERMDTLLAGGGVAETEVVRLVQDEPLGLRPEFTASIARAAGTRFADRPRPLRLWASGPTFRQVLSDEGSGAGLRIQEQIQSGVELFGEPSAAAERELLHLLVAACQRLGLGPRHAPRLLIGHHGILSALLAQVPPQHQAGVRQALTQLDLLALEAVPLDATLRQQLGELIGLRGAPTAVVDRLRPWLDDQPMLDDLQSVLGDVDEVARMGGIELQLDPTFQPHFHLYDGLVFQLVCQGSTAPVVVASGGRYNGLVGRFSGVPDNGAGLGFAFAIDVVSDLLAAEPSNSESEPWLVVTNGRVNWLNQRAKVAELHGQGQAAELGTEICPSAEAAETLAAARGCRGAIWLTE